MSEPTTPDRPKRTVYLSGPMTGLPEFNYPAFHAAAARLRAAGLTVVNPAEAPPQPSWEAYMRLAVASIADLAHVLVLLPGWEHSRGALGEIYVAALLGIPRVLYTDEAALGLLAAGGQPVVTQPLTMIRIPEGD